MMSILRCKNNQNIQNTKLFLFFSTDILLLTEQKKGAKHEFFIYQKVLPLTDVLLAPVILLFLSPVLLVT